MVCPRCNLQLSDTARACPRCGAKIYHVPWRTPVPHADAAPPLVAGPTDAEAAEVVAKAVVEVVAEAATVAAATDNQP